MCIYVHIYLYINIYTFIYININLCIYTFYKSLYIFEIIQVKENQKLHLQTTWKWVQRQIYKCYGAVFKE